MRITQRLFVGDDIRTAIPSFSALRAGARVFVDRKSLGVLVAVEKVRDSESLLIERGAFGYALLVWKDVPCVLMRFTNEARDGVEYRCTLNANNTAGWERLEGGVSEDPISGDVSDEDEGGEEVEGAPFRRVMVYAITMRGIVSVIRSVSFYRHHVERVFTALNRHSGRYEDGERLREVEVALQEMSVDELIQKGGYYPMM